MKAPKVTIVGGGILGITTGILARMRGAPTRLVAAERCDLVDPVGADPNFASLYPAASVIPHSVALDGLEETLATSMAVFEDLRQQIPAVVRRQWHYEIFEDTAPEASYLGLLDDVELLSSEQGSSGPLQRSSEIPVSGWRFRGLFVECPQYKRLLFRAFEELGGSIEIERFEDRQDLLSLEGDVLVVCAGMGTPRLLGRSEHKYFEEGVLVRLPFELDSLDREPASYNYWPRAPIHPGDAGSAMDVYAYPRADSLILGGTRLAGVESPRDEATVAPYQGPMTTIRDHRGQPYEVPAAILEINRILLEQLLGIDFRDAPMEGLVGRRYRGSSPHAPIQELTETRDGKKIVACYGLGGSGVTLSWGLAARLISRIVAAPESTAAHLSPELIQQISHVLRRQ